ncbi:YTH-domain-containing protein, partial [Gonapodya prolifera JEL478]
RFFVIKSYTEDDVHKSLKYSIWSSTDMGNRRLNQAYLDTSATGAGNRPGTSGSVYLFFSVNASGHFCGVATMTSKVDWETSASVWAQGGKWKGVFGVRWVFVKDVPNGALRHLRVITNENKPVTNSRDTQELPTDIGREMLRIFCEYKHTTCILDDWGWHEKKESEKNGEGGTAEPTADGGSNGASSGSNLLNIGDVMRMNGTGHVADGNGAKRTGSGGGGRW